MPLHVCLSFISRNSAGGPNRVESCAGSAVSAPAAREGCAMQAACTPAYRGYVRARARGLRGVESLLVE